MEIFFQMLSVFPKVWPTSFLRNRNKLEIFSILDLQAINIKPLNSIGLIALPVNIGCSLPVVNDYITCAICNMDCIYVHNTYGGKCGPHPHNPKEFTCLCAHTLEDARKRGISLSSSKTCKTCLPSVLGKI